MIKPIPSFPDYHASSEGKIYSTKLGQDYKELSQRKDDWGYYQVNLWRDGKIFVKKAHKMIAEAFHGAPPEAHYQVDHKDGNKENNRPDNLEYVSPSENQKRAYAKASEKAIMIDGCILSISNKQYRPFRGTLTLQKKSV